MSITISDIARTSGVSLSTVSAVLNNSHTKIRVSELTRRKVLEAARQLNYQPSFSARALARGKTFSLGFVCGDIHTPFFAELTSRFMQESDARGYHLLVAATQWDRQKELECIDNLLQRKVDGILTVPTSLQPGTRQYDYIVKNQIPIVGLQPALQGLSLVASDWRTGMDEAIRHLKHKGHDRVVLVDISSDPLVGLVPGSKRTAFLESCRGFGIEPMEYENVIDLHENRRIGRELADRPDRPRAFIVGSDYTAMGIIRGLRDGGLDVPRDAAVIAMDGTTLGEFFHPPLTTIAQNLDLIISRALELLLKMIESKSLITESILIPTKLIVRESA